MTQALTDQIILITGAGRGVGRTLAEALAAEGASIAAVDISPLLLAEVEEAIHASGGECCTYASDMAKKRIVQGVVEEVLEDWGHIDVLINAGYVNPKGGILALDEWDWQRSLDVNLSGVFYALQAFGRVAREGAAGGGEEPRGGAVVNIIPGTGNPALTVSASALLRLTHESAHELESGNVHVNAVYPQGMTEEDLMRHILRYSTATSKRITGMAASKTGEYPISEVLL